MISTTARQRPPPEAGRNARNVWQIPTQGRSDRHFASFPDELPKRCILAGTSEHGVCAECGAPRVRVVEKERKIDSAHDDRQNRKARNGSDAHLRQGRRFCQWNAVNVHHPNRRMATIVRLRNHGHGSRHGSGPVHWQGTTSIVAQRLGRRSVGVDLNADYLALAQKNLTAVTLPLGV